MQKFALLIALNSTGAIVNRSDQNDDGRTRLLGDMMHSYLWTTGLLGSNGRLMDC